MVLDSASLRVPGMLISHNKGNTVALVSGPYLTFLRHHAEKYSKFAYSSRYGFNVENNLKDFSTASLDNMIGFSYTGRDFFFRESRKSWIFEDGLYSEWSPSGANDIEIKTWILLKENYHIRVYRVYNNSSLDVNTHEGGFAVSTIHENQIEQKKSLTPKPIACLTTSKDTTLIVNLLDERKSRISEPNSNMISSKVVLPQLEGKIGARSSAQFACAIYAQPKDRSFDLNHWQGNIELPSEEELESLMSKFEDN